MMSDIRLSKLIAPHFYAAHHDIKDHKHTEWVLPGGRGSTKSSFVSIEIVLLIKQHPSMHAMICRQVKDTLKDSVYAQMLWAIDALGCAEEFKCTKSPLEIVYIPTGQTIYFRGADDPYKIKSIKPRFGYIGILWFEELDTFTGAEQIRNIEQSVMRGGNEFYEFKSFNPPQTIQNWANLYIQEPDIQKIVVPSTYLTVPAEWLGSTFIDRAEHLKEVNQKEYEHEYLGVANGTGGQVFEYLEIREITDAEIANMDRIYEGVDWGYYPDYYAFTRLYYDAARETVYAIDEHCVNKASNRETAQWILDHGYNDNLQFGIVCDSAETKSVADYIDLGVTAARKAYKPPESVVYGLKWMQRRKWVIDPKRTPVLYKEFTKYEYDTDKDGNYISSYPDKDNHCIDSARYAMSPVWQRRDSQM